MRTALLRRVGVGVLIVGILAAAWVYWNGTRNWQPGEEELLAGYQKQMNREMAVQMGTFGLVMMQWTNALKRPGTQAVIVATGSALLAWGCFRLAREHEGGEGHEA
jgi:hypothetical protein